MAVWAHEKKQFLSGNVVAHSNVISDLAFSQITLEFLVLFAVKSSKVLFTRTDILGHVALNAGTACFNEEIVVSVEGLGRSSVDRRRRS